MKGKSTRQQINQSQMYQLAVIALRELLAKEGQESVLHACAEALAQEQVENSHHSVFTSPPHGHVSVAQPGIEPSHPYLLTKSQAAERLQVSVRTVDRLIAKQQRRERGGLEFVKVGRSVRFTSAGIERYIKQAMNISSATDSA